MQNLSSISFTNSSFGLNMLQNEEFGRILNHSSAHETVTSTSLQNGCSHNGTSSSIQSKCFLNVTTDCDSDTSKIPELISELVFMIFERYNIKLIIDVLACLQISILSRIIKIVHFSKLKIFIYILMKTIFKFLFLRTCLCTILILIWSRKRKYAYNTYDSQNILKIKRN